MAQHAYGYAFWAPQGQAHASTKKRRTYKMKLKRDVDNAAAINMKSS